MHSKRRRQASVAENKWNCYLLKAASEMTVGHAKRQWAEDSGRHKNFFLGLSQSRNLRQRSANDIDIEIMQ